MTGNLAQELRRSFLRLCSEVDRQGIIGLVPAESVVLIPEQAQYLQDKLSALRSAKCVTAVSLGLSYHEHEIRAVPAVWKNKASPDDCWNEYARAYQSLNHLLKQLAASLTAQFGGVSEQATMEGWTRQVHHVTDYFSCCVSHRAFAEAAGLGWRGRHGLLVTPQFGPAVRFATLFIPGSISQPQQAVDGCGDCRACLDICPILRKGGEYRERCRRRLATLGLQDEVCGICVRVCWEQVMRCQAHSTGQVT